MTFANCVIAWLLLSGIGSLMVWRELCRRKLVWWAVGNVVLAFLAYNVALPADSNIRVDLLLTVPLVLIVVVKAMQKRPPAP